MVSKIYLVVHTLVKFDAIKHFEIDVSQCLEEKRVCYSTVHIVEKREYVIALFI